jgi:cold shock CspA family protein
MRGQVTTFEEGAGGGTITGDNGEIYNFSASSIRSAAPLVAGQRVDFVAHEGVATQVYALDGPPVGQAPASRVGSVYGAFDLGRVIQRTFNSISQNGVTFLIGSILLVGVPSVAQVYGQSQLLEGQTSAFAIVGISWVLWIVGAYVLQGMVVKVTVAGFNGKAMSIGAAFEAGIKLFLPLLGLGIVIGLGTMLGMILLIVPGIILAVMWSVATGAVVVEGRGVMESLQRSRDLTRGHRWPIFGLAVILFVASMIIGVLAGGIGAASGGGFMTGSPNLIVNMATTSLSNILSAVLGAAGAAALYYELRSVKEGVGPEQLASVFD